jgi:aminoglycoside 6'-N-acetyltransferase
MEPSLYSFRRAGHDDLPLLRGWLRTPEVMRWWGDPDEQFTLLREDLDEPRMVMRIVQFERRPFAYAQDYEVHSWPQPHLAALPVGTRAIDAFIGEPTMLGLGHGAHFLRRLAERLSSEGAPVVAIDPDASNLRARCAYEKAGFRVDSIVETGRGRAILMLFDRGRQGRLTIPSTKTSS